LATDRSGRGLEEAKPEHMICSAVGCQQSRNGKPIDYWTMK